MIADALDDPISGCMLLRRGRTVLCSEWKDRGTLLDSRKSERQLYHSAITNGGKRTNGGKTPKTLYC